MRGYPEELLLPSQLSLQSSLLNPTAHCTVIKTNIIIVIIIIMIIIVRKRTASLREQIWDKFSRIITLGRFKGI